jgi:hypothetical protein
VFTESELHHAVRRIQPRFFGSADGRDDRFITDIWTLPAGRVLFACAERSPSVVDPALIVQGLYVLDHITDRLRSIDKFTALSREVAVAKAIEWMQGLRVENLRDYDQSVLGWLGEMAFRMRPEDLAAFQERYLAVPFDAWGSPDNPDPSPGEALDAYLSELGYSDEFLSLHLP